jgi:dolichol-phosphate mannosyltransferase
MTDTHRVFIALPVLNEIENIEPLLDRIDSSLCGHDYVVCVVDDGSRDGTREYLHRRLNETPDRLHVIERTKRQRGSQRGGALHVALEWGLANSECDVFVEMDGDLSHRPEEMPSALRHLRSSGADVIIASKYVKHSDVINRPLGRRLVSQVCSMVVHVFLSRKVRDYSNGYRFYTRGAAELIRATRIRYTSPIYLSEVLAIWLRAGLQVVEIPTIYVGRGEGLSKLRPTDFAKAAVAIVDIAFRYHVLGFRRRPIPPKRRVDDRVGRPDSALEKRGARK